ncbi:hypothetical protein [Terrihalobacillus insolitus]|uniref:hypothetical protein n=1 Tax=Terrihalobacillus insolitus TaxID=2950438 RepID=UPI0023407EB0|nr:hypothetical protein [Terrihalobacillus insolitus]MDC3413973.1 hypothetical protein [Terrihalobacillus insolitus]
MGNYETCVVSDERIYEDQECYFSQITNCYYISFEAAIFHHKQLGYTEEEIKEANEELVIYYTTYAE